MTRKTDAEGIALPHRTHAGHQQLARQEWGDVDSSEAVDDSADYGNDQREEESEYEGRVVYTLSNVASFNVVSQNELLPLHPAQDVNADTGVHLTFGCINQEGPEYDQQDVGSQLGLK